MPTQRKKERKGRKQNTPLAPKAKLSHRVARKGTKEKTERGEDNNK